MVDTFEVSWVLHGVRMYLYAWLAQTCECLDGEYTCVRLVCVCLCLVGTYESMFSSMNMSVWFVHVKVWVYKCVFVVLVHTSLCLVVRICVYELCWHVRACPCRLLRNSQGVNWHVHFCVSLIRVVICEIGAQVLYLNSSIKGTSWHVPVHAGC